MSCRSKKGGRRRRGAGSGGEQGTQTAGRQDNREGDLLRRAVAADKGDERARHDGGWATLLLSCLLLGFEICKVQLGVTT